MPTGGAKRKPRVKKHPTPDKQPQTTRPLGLDQLFRTTGLSRQPPSPVLRVTDIQALFQRSGGKTVQQKPPAKSTIVKKQPTQKKKTSSPKKPQGTRPVGLNLSKQPPSPVLRVTDLQALFQRNGGATQQTVKKPQGTRPPLPVSQGEGGSQDQERKIRTKTRKRHDSRRLKRHLTNVKPASARPYDRFTMTYDQFRRFPHLQEDEHDTQKW